MSKSLYHDNIREHRSEYKNRFRPFSQYEYIGDGKFLNTSTSPPNEIDNPSVRWPKQAPARQENLSGEPWYQEVIELRKTANDYKVSKIYLGSVKISHLNAGFGS